MAHTTAPVTSGRAATAPSTSVSAMRFPRTFTWRSVRPTIVSTPSGDQRPRSPVRNSRLDRSAEKRAAVSASSAQ